jgi:nicotinate-nucleotide adenylyltransferase
MKLCIFAGTFNPIHKAHLKMAQLALENYGFDKILFIPAYKPPHKDTDLSEHRYKMVEIAIANNPKFEISDIEYKREGKSYTYLTVLELYKKFKIDGKISFIIGKDAYDSFDTWYEAEKLKKLIDFVVFDRIPEDISSSEIRQRVKLGKSIKDFVAKDVGDYIERYNLYK